MGRKMKKKYKNQQHERAVDDRIGRFVSLHLTLLESRLRFLWVCVFFFAVDTNRQQIIYPPKWARFDVANELIINNDDLLLMMMVMMIAGTSIICFLRAMRSQCGLFLPHRSIDARPVNWRILWFCLRSPARTIFRFSFINKFTNLQFAYHYGIEPRPPYDCDWERDCWTRLRRANIRTHFIWIYLFAYRMWGNRNPNMEIAELIRRLDFTELKILIDCYYYGINANCQQHRPMREGISGLQCANCPSHNDELESNPKISRVFM